MNDSATAQAKTAKGQARVEQILKAARQLFIDGGYSQMTLRQVASQVGISLSNVQHYFPSRETLLQALLESVMNSYDPPLAAIRERISDPRQRLAAAVRYFLADVKQAETERLFVEIWSLATREPVAREIFDTMYAHHRGVLADLIAEANPALPPGTVQLRAAIVAMQIEGLMLLISDSKPRHAELAGIEDECVAGIMSIVLREHG